MTGARTSQLLYRTGAPGSDFPHATNAGWRYGPRLGARHDVAVVVGGLARSAELRVFLRRQSSIKHCAATQAGARCNGTRILPTPTHGPALQQCGAFSRASGGGLRALPEHLVNEFAQDIRAGRDIPVIFMQDICAQHVEPLQPVAIDLHFKSLGSARVWSRHGRIRKSWFHRNIRFSRFIVNNPEETPLSLLTFLTDGTYYQGINNTGALMKSLPTLTAAAALFAGFTVFAPAPAAAGDMTPISTIGHWTIYADATACKARGVYADDTTLEFYITSRGVADIVIINPKWAIPSGHYNVVAWVDRAPAKTFTATGTDDWVMWAIPLDEPTLNLLSHGNMLYATIGSQAFNYRLIRSEAMLKALGQCAAPKIAAANPFAGSPPAASTETPASTDAPSNPFRRL